MATHARACIGMSCPHLVQLVDRLTSVGEYYSIDTRDLGSLAVKVVIMCLKPYVSREAVFHSLFPEGFVDWGLERPQDQGGEGGNLLGDHHSWIPLLHCFSWPEPERPELVHPRLAFLRKQMRASNLDVGGHTLVCKLFLVQMLHSIPTLQTLVMLSCELLKRDTHQSCALLLAGLAENHMTPQECEAVLVDILGDQLSIDTEPLAACVAMTKLQRTDRERGLRMKQMTSYMGRPRLRDRLEQSSAEALQLDTVLGTWESYTGFCQVHQFPHVLSDIIKQRLYFLAAQTAWDWKDYTALVVRHQGPIAERLAQYPVTNPDQHVLCSVIGALSMDGSPPFPELITFRSKCFRSFPVSQTQRMPLSQVLRLYACAYQNPTIWKTLWKSQMCLISPHIIKDVESFVLATPFASPAFMKLLCQRADPSTPSVQLSHLH